MVGSIQYSPVAASSLESFISLHDKPGSLCRTPRRAKKKKEVLTVKMMTGERKKENTYDTIENRNLKINCLDYTLFLSSDDADTNTDTKIKRSYL